MKVKVWIQNQNYSGEGFENHQFDVDLIMSQMSSPNSSSSSRSPVTLGDFIKKRRNKNKSSPDSNKFFSKFSPSRSPRSLFTKDGQIDFSVNDINFEKVQTKKCVLRELKWTENDVDFSKSKTCSYKKCLQNDENIRPFNNFRNPSYSSDDSDINFNNEHYFLPESQHYEDCTVSYFSFDRVEEDVAEYLYQGTTYYNVDGQVTNLSSSSLSNVTDTMANLDISTESDETTVDTKAEELEKDEELNNIVISIIDD